jgi:hypothetical protein
MKSIWLVVVSSVILFSTGANAISINLNINYDRADFSLSAREGDKGFGIGVHYLEGDGWFSVIDSHIKLLGELKGVKGSIVIEQSYRLSYRNEDLFHPPYFTPVLYTDFDFFTRGIDTSPAENVYYDPITGAGYATESYEHQLDVLYAVVALGDGLKRVDVSDYDDVGQMWDRHTPRLNQDSALNVGLSFTDPSLQTGDTVSVTFRHLIALGIDEVPRHFAQVPEPSTLILLGVGLAGLSFASYRKGRCNGSRCQYVVANPVIR